MNAESVHIGEFGALTMPDVGRDKRLFTDRQRQGMAVRDGGCLWPGCDRPPSWTEAHHIDNWLAKKGLTNVEEGCLLCRLHHLLLHNQGWVIQRRGPAEYWLVPPPNSGPDKKPIRLQSKSPLHLGSPVQPKAAGPTDQAGGRDGQERQDRPDEQNDPDRRAAPHERPETAPSEAGAGAGAGAGAVDDGRVESPDAA